MLSLYRQVSTGEPVFLGMPQAKNIGFVTNSNRRMRGKKLCLGNGVQMFGVQVLCPSNGVLFRQGWLNKSVASAR